MPQSLPNNARMQECWFDLIDNISAVPSKNGNVINLSQVNDPVWKGVFVTPILERDVRPIWSSWKKSLRGGLNQFIAYDVRHSRLLAYPNSISPSDVSGSWDGLATVTNLGLSGALSLSGLPTAFVFKAGDRIGLEQSGYYGYYEVLDSMVTAVAGALTVTVAPFLHTGLFTNSAVCRVWRPVCKFILDQSSWSEQGTVQNTPISFNGFQRL